MIYVLAKPALPTAADTEGEKQNSLAYADQM